MWLKLIGSIIVIAAASGMGYAAARRYSERPRQIRHLLGFLQSLEAYINYASLPLSEAIRMSCRGAFATLSCLFEAVAERLEAENGTPPEQALDESLRVCAGDLALDRPEIEVLFHFMSNIGRVDSDEQIKFFRLAECQLRDLEREAAVVRDRNVKMYRYLGVCGGLLVVIVLV